MTWHAVTIASPKWNITMWRELQPRKTWCLDNLSSNGVLWKHGAPEWNTFYFAQEQDAIMFKIIFGTVNIHDDDA